MFKNIYRSSNAGSRGIEKGGLPMRIVVSLRRGSVSIKLREQTMCLRKQETDAGHFVYYLSRFLTNKV